MLSSDNSKYVKKTNPQKKGVALLSQ